MKLIYKEIVIHTATHDDAEILTTWWNDGSIMEHAGFPLGIGTTVEKVKEQLLDTSKVRLVIEYESIPIGEMCYIPIDDTTVEIGIKICDQAYQNRGLGKVILSMLIKHLFDIGYQRIILDTMLSNTRAQHVYESLGFIRTAIHYDSWKDQLGILRSSVDYALSPEHFKNYMK